ncbi:MAG: DUF4339 domain-containing protein [Thermoguttaceae bacterium]
MGIRFYCPNGHKLNVKEFQAGRKGICPFCGVKFLIPTQSTRKSSKEERAALKDLAAASTDVFDPKQTMDFGAAVPLPTTDSPGVAQSLDRSTTANNYVPLPPTPPSYASRADPIAAAGDVVWYIRPSAGGQYGPATNDVVLRWLAEGRIASDTLVWHEGWHEWQPASTVFPQLAGSNVAADFYPAAADLHSPSLPGVMPSRKNRDSSTFRIRSLIIIIILLIVLFIFGFYFWYTHVSG